MCEVRTDAVTAVEMTDWRGADYKQLPSLVSTMARDFTLREISADKAYSGSTNLAAMDAEGAVPFIPFRTRAATETNPSTLRPRC